MSRGFELRQKILTDEEVKALLANIVPRGHSPHWEGCWKVHAICALVRLAESHEALSRLGWSDRRLTESEKELVIRRLKRGDLQKAIAADLKVTQGCISRIAVLHGLRRRGRLRRRAGRLPPEVREQIVNEIRGGAKRDFVAQRYSISPSLVSKILSAARAAERQRQEGGVT